MHWGLPNNCVRCIGDCQKLGEVVGIKVGLSLIFSDRAARGGVVNENSFSYKEIRIEVGDVTMLGEVFSIEICWRSS